MKKKALLLSGVIVSVLLIFTVAVSKIQSAAVVSTVDLLNPIGLLGAQVLTGEVILHIVNADEMMENQNYELPDANSHDGDIYIFKLVGGIAEYTFNILPASGDSLDTVGSVNISSPGDYYTFVGDSASSTWWIISQR